MPLIFKSLPLPFTFPNIIHFPLIDIPPFFLICLFLSLFVNQIFLILSSFLIHLSSPLPNSILPDPYSFLLFQTHPPTTPLYDVYEVKPCRHHSVGCVLACLDSVPHLEMPPLPSFFVRLLPSAKTAPQPQMPQWRDNGHSHVNYSAARHSRPCQATAL